MDALDDQRYLLDLLLESALNDGETHLQAKN